MLSLTVPGVVAPSPHLIVAFGSGFIRLFAELSQCASSLIFDIQENVLVSGADFIVIAKAIP